MTFERHVLEYLLAWCSLLGPRGPPMSSESYPDLGQKTGKDLERWPLMLEFERRPEVRLGLGESDS